MSTTDLVATTLSVLKARPRALTPVVTALQRTLVTTVTGVKILTLQAILLAYAMHLVLVKTHKLYNYFVLFLGFSAHSYASKNPQV